MNGGVGYFRQPIRVKAERSGGHGAVKLVRMIYKKITID